MSVETTDSSNIHIQTLSCGSTSFPAGSTLKAKYVDGKKEGPATVLSVKKTRLALLNYHEDKLNGYCVFYDLNGRKQKEGCFVDDLQNGWGCEYTNSTLSFMGIYRNGCRYSELSTYSDDESYLVEKKDKHIESICPYNENHQRHGICYLYSHDSLCSAVRYVNGEKKNTILEFHINEMTEFNEKGEMVYRGQFKGNIHNGFKSSGVGDCYNWKNGKIANVTHMLNGKITNRIEFTGDVMKEYQLDSLVYEGGFCQKDNRFVRHGIGIVHMGPSSFYQGVFDKGNEVKRIQEFQNTELLEYDSEGKLVYRGGFTKKKSGYSRSGNGHLFVYERNVLKEEHFCENGESVGKQREFQRNPTHMSEFSKEGCLVYKGEYKGTPRDDFSRDGEGDEYDDNDMLVYSGTWKNNERTGKGLFYKNGVLLFEGFWKKNLPNGFGKRFYDRGDVMCEGDWINGYCRQGKTTGVFYETGETVGLYDDGTLSYRGELLGSEFHGKGQSYSRDGKVCYDGEWSHGEKNGRGIEYDNTGEKEYEGNWKNGSFDGYGKTFHDGSIVYEGEWKNNKYNGKGIEYYENGNVKYDGEWKDGCYCGEGKLYEDDGSLRFEGRWKNSTPDGEGVYYENGKALYEGNWKNGVVFSLMELSWFDYNKNESTNLIVWTLKDCLWEKIIKDYLWEDVLDESIWTLIAYILSISMIVMGIIAIISWKNVRKPDDCGRDCIDCYKKKRRNSLTVGIIGIVLGIWFFIWYLCIRMMDTCCFSDCQKVTSYFYVFLSFCFVIAVFVVQVVFIEWGCSYYISWYGYVYVEFGINIVSSIYLYVCWLDIICKKGFYD